MAAIQGLCIGLNLFVAVATEPAWDWSQAPRLILVLWPDQLRWNGGRGLPAPVGQLGDTNTSLRRSDKSSSHELAPLEIEPKSYWRWSSAA